MLSTKTRNLLKTERSPEQSIRLVAFELFLVPIPDAVKTLNMAGPLASAITDTSEVKHSEAKPGISCRC